MFNNNRYITSGIANKIPLSLQILMWDMIDKLKIQKDYLQVFKLSEENGKQKIIHIQEQPEYSKEYLLNTDAPFFNATIFVIDSIEYSTMLFSNEY